MRFDIQLILILSGFAACGNLVSAQEYSGASGYSFPSQHQTGMYSYVPAWQPAGSAAAYAPVSLPQVSLNPALTQPLMDFQNRQADKETFLIDPALNPWSGQPSLTLGAQFRASAMVGRTNTANSFPYLGRFPTDFVGNTVTDARLLQANQAFVANFSPVLRGYMETLFSDVFTFDDPKQGSFQVRQAYVVLGDLSRSPWYLFGGKKNVSFGDLSTLNPFTQAVPWHYFAPLTEGIGGGYSSDWVNFSVTALNGSRGIRVADSEERGHLNNFAANILFRAPLGDAAELSIGGGYLYGSIYDGEAAEHLDATVTGPRNGIWDVNAQLQLGAFLLRGEFIQTEKEWPVTAEKVTAYTAEAAYDFLLSGVPTRFSGGWSEGIQGPDSSQFEFNRQLVVGLRMDPRPNVRLTLEYVRSTGFAPLINITTVSNRDVAQNSFVFGLVIAI